MSPMQEREIRYYERNRKRFLKLYHYKYLLISNQRVCGVYDTHRQAYEDAIRTREIGTFIIKHLIA